MGFFNIFKKNRTESTLNKTEKTIREEDEIIEAKIDKYEYEFLNLSSEIEDVIKKEILRVVKANGSFQELKESAEIAANNVGEKNIDLLPQYLIDKIEKPEELTGRFEEEGQWGRIVENSVLMIIFSYKEKGIHILTQIAYGDTSLNLKAINLLVRHAINGVYRDNIIDDIMSNINKFNNKEKIIILGFTSQIKGNDKVIALIQYFFKEFLKDNDVENAYETIVHLINAAERWTTGHLSFLKHLAIEKNKLNLKEIIDVKVGEKEYINIENVTDLTRIAAAITFYNIEKKDKYVNNMLIFWSENYEEEDVRDEIKRILHK